MTSAILAAQQGISKLEIQLGIPNAAAMDPNDIELNMHSPLEMVELRDLLVELRELRARVR